MPDQPYFFNWQNPVLRRTIYPFREKKLRDFLLTYYEIDVWKSLKEADPEKDKNYQQTRSDLIDWTYQRLKGLEKKIGSEEARVPKYLEELNQEKEFLLEYEDSFPRKTRIKKTLEGLDGNGTEVFNDDLFAQYPQKVKKVYLQAIIKENDQEYKKWNEELQLRLKFRDMAEVGTRLYSWWQDKVDQATQMVAEISTDLEKLKSVTALLQGQKNLVSIEKLISQTAIELHENGIIEGDVFTSGRYSLIDQYEYLTIVIDEKTQERAKWEKNLERVKNIDAQLGDLNNLKDLLDQRKSLPVSLRLRSALKELDVISQYVFKLERYARYPQAYQDRYLAVVIDHNFIELQAWEESLKYRQTEKDKTDKESTLHTWWERMINEAERYLMIMRSDLERFKMVKQLLDQEKQSLNQEKWISQVMEVFSAIRSGFLSPGRHSRDFIHKYLDIIIDEKTRHQDTRRAGGISENTDFIQEKVTQVKKLLEEEKRFLEQEEIVSISEQIRDAVNALDPTSRSVFKSSHYTRSEKYQYLSVQVDEKALAGVSGADIEKLNKVKRLLEQENGLFRRRKRELDHERLEFLKKQIDAVVEKQEIYFNNDINSSRPETEKYSDLSQIIEGKIKERDLLEDELNKKWRKNRDAWKEMEGEQGKNYKYWKRRTDEKEQELKPILIDLAELTYLKDILEEERRLRNQEKTIPLSEQINRDMGTLGPIDLPETSIFASDRFSFTDKLDYLEALIAERSREQVEWENELLTRQRNRQLVGEEKSLHAWFQEKMNDAEQILKVINSELDQLKGLKESYHPGGNIVDRRGTRQEKSSLARLALIRKEIELGKDLLSSEQQQDEINLHNKLLKMILEMFDDQPGRFPKWLQYMVIHFSGMRYSTAHYSWFDPGDLLRIMKAEQPQLFSHNDAEFTPGDGISETPREIEPAIPIPADIEALETLQGYRIHVPPWAWKEIVRFTPLRLRTTDSSWEKPEPERNKYDTEDKKLWNGILNEWLDRKKMTLWRERHEETLDIVMTRCVCNEIAENTLHTRGIKPGGGLTGKVNWYNNYARKTPERPDNDPLKALFLRPTTSGDFRPAASIFWLDWRPQCLYDDQAAQYSQVSIHNLLPDKINLRGNSVDKEGWHYAWESNRVIRRKLKYADPNDPKKFNKAQVDQIVNAQRSRIEAKIKNENKSLKGNSLTKAINKAIRDLKAKMKTAQLKEYLRWTHEAIVIGVEDTLDGLQVLTYETAPGGTGLNRRYLSGLVNTDNNSNGQQVFVGYVPPLNHFPDDQDPYSFLPGAYLKREAWPNIQARLNEMLRRDLILPGGGYAKRTYPKPPPPEEKRFESENGIGMGSQESLKAMPGFWVEAAPKLDKKAPDKGWMNKEAMDFYAVGRKNMTKTKVKLKRGSPLRVAKLKKEKHHKVWHYLVTHCPDMEDAEGLYVREHDFIKIPKHRAGILVRAKGVTKAQSFKKTDGKGKPIISSAEAKLNLDAEFIVSGVHRISDKDPDKYQPGTILITGEQPYYLVIDCPPNRDAEGLLVRAREVEEVRVIPLDMDEILKRRREAKEENQNRKSVQEPEWSVVNLENKREARLFNKIETDKTKLSRYHHLTLKQGTTLQIDPPQTVEGKSISRILICPEESGAVGRYVLSKELTQAVEKILTKDSLLSIVKGILSDQFGTNKDFEVQLDAKSATEPRPRLLVSSKTGDVSYALELGVRDGRLVIENADSSLTDKETKPWMVILSGNLEEKARPQPESILLSVLVRVNSDSGEKQLALYWQRDT